MAAVTLIGSPVSPYVRKVLACCALKGVEVGVDPITPFMGDQAFAAISPLRRIPVWIEGDVTLCDSSVIVQYIEETRPELSAPDDRQRAAVVLPAMGVQTDVAVIPLVAARYLFDYQARD